MTLLAVSRDDVAEFVYTFAVILAALVLVRVIMTFIPRVPYYRWLDAFLTFVTQVTDPLLHPSAAFRRFAWAGRARPGADDRHVPAAVRWRNRGSADQGLLTPAAGWARAIAAVAMVMALDQGSKQLVKNSLQRGESVNVFFGLDITNTRNTGVAFGALEGSGAIVAVLIGLALIMLLGYFAVNAGRPWLWLPVGMLLGGALGNLVDRVREGAVVDFIDPVAWPAFNLADSAIVVGVVGLLYIVELRPTSE